MRTIFRAASVSAGLSFAIVSTAFAAPAASLPSDTFVATWTSLPTTRFVPDAQVPVTLVKTKSAAVPTILVDDAIASARDGRARRDVTLLEMSSGWAQPIRTALWNARDAESGYSTATAAFTPDGTRDDRFVALVRQIDDGAGRSAASDEDVAAADAGVGPAYAIASDKTDPTKRAALRESQTAWIAYREAMLTLAAAKSPGLVPSVRRQMDESRTVQLSRIAQ